MKKRTIDLDKQVEVLRGMEVPMVDGHPMTIGELIVRLLPVEASNSEQAVRLWRVAMDMDRAGGGEFELTELDFEMLKKALLRGERPTWVHANLSETFGGD